MTLYARLALLLLAIGVATAIYHQGYQSATLDYAAQISEQKTKYIDDTAALDKRIFEIEARAAEKVGAIQNVYIPIEKEIIKFVSQPRAIDDCQPDISQWVQLHNTATATVSRLATGGADATGGNARAD